MAEVPDQPRLSLYRKLINKLGPNEIERSISMSVIMAIVALAAIGVTVGSVVSNGCSNSGAVLDAQNNAASAVAKSDAALATIKPVIEEANQNARTASARLDELQRMVSDLEERTEELTHRVGTIESAIKQQTGTGIGQK